MKNKTLSCPYCGSGNIRCQQTYVRREFRMRRRNCLDCGKTFYTGQPPEMVVPCLDPRIHPLYPWFRK